MDPTRRQTIQERMAAAQERARADPRWQLPGWVASRARLTALFSPAEKLDHQMSMSPDPICAAATRLGAPLNFTLLPYPHRTNPGGEGEVSFEALTKLELFDRVFEKFPPTPGPLGFIPDDCFWARREPYLTSGEVLREFVADCPCSLHHDVLFIWTESPRVSLIHHEGGYAHIFLPTA